MAAGSQAVSGAEQNTALSLYPNPSSGSFNINAAGRFTYRIVDQLGKEAEKGQGSNKARVGQKLAPGVYLITIENNGKLETIKIVKQ